MIHDKKRYEEYLESEDWKSIKKKVIKREKGECQGCGDSNIPLDVHHLTYERIGDELLTDLVAYCRYCHIKAHNKSSDKSAWYKYIKFITNDKPKCSSEMTKEEMMKCI